MPGHPLGRLLRFNLTTGAISVAGNLAFMSLLVEQAHLPFLMARSGCKTQVGTLKTNDLTWPNRGFAIGSNLVTITLCSLASFVLGDWFVFRPQFGTAALGALDCGYRTVFKAKL